MALESGISKTRAALPRSGTGLAFADRMNGDVNPAEHSPLTSNAPLRRAEHMESSLTRVIEQQTAKIPSHFFLTAAFGAMALSAALEVKANARASRFIGGWVAPLLLMGVYNKLVKTFGTY